MRRRVQLIAGTTYTISLPKDWVLKNNIKERDELSIIENNNRSLSISISDVGERKLNEITINIDEHINNIDQILFAVYYLGIENINLVSKNDFGNNVKAGIRKTLTNMSGTEITFEDKQKISIKVFLDKSKLDINQLLYRISLIIENSISNIIYNLQLEEIKINEDEIDRLYHLVAKLVSLSLINTSILQSSKVNNVSTIPSYFLIGKRLENIADNVNHISDYLFSDGLSPKKFKDILEFVVSCLQRGMKYFIGNDKSVFNRTDKDIISKFSKEIHSLDDPLLVNYLDNILRYVTDIEEEIVNVSFCRKLIEEGKI